jgi:hypothetical protein
MVVMTLLFGGSGLFLMIEGLGLLIVRPRRRQTKRPSVPEDAAHDSEISRAA